MKINFTKKQYRALLELVYLGEWTANSSKDVVDREDKFEELSQYIYSFAKDFGYENSITFDKQYDSYFPTRELDEDMEKYIEENEEDVFWIQLVTRLANRDVMKESALHPDRDALTRRAFEIEDVYEEEFENHGLHRLMINKDM